ncbi:kinesin-like protein KIF19 isoform X1 [Stegostoma tigrinum]|uniref:kinesin-like protein KIF19 isoform X1 n=2 Tax=Stegostoma tigrinum TaxID=3053191 RepID=UPI00202B3B04|nr:kinesin-like protein KIF19 isoform X1 [Stegostoma tigrinum]
MKDGGESKDQQLTVALRIRPINETEVEEGATIIAHKVDEQMVVLMDPMEDPDDILRANRSREKLYMFDVTFNYTASQDDVYRATTKGLIEGIISGYNATVFAYGPTGAGKTYTMLGTDYEPGIYVRTLNDLFKCIEETSDDMEYTVSMSYLEIYNEMIRDLLNPSSGFLDLREDSKGGIQIAGITEVSTINAKEIMQLLVKGNKQRTQEPTAANKTSSRSHAVLQVTVRQKSRIKNILQEVRIGRLFMIDLAGSERASQTQNRGKRMKEGAHINRSLLALGNCINALSERGGNKYVNYRDSKLTRLLKDSLGGNSRTVMIAHISPASLSFEESRNTLTYADRAKNIKTRVKRNLMNVSYHIAQYTNIISDLRSEIHRLKKKIDTQRIQQTKNDKTDIRNVQAEVQLHSSRYDRREMERLREHLITAFREQMDIRRNLLELDSNNMQIQVDTSRHLLTIADWVQEKARRAKKWREEHRKEVYSKEDSEKDSDTGDDQSDVMEPAEVAVARESIAALVAEQKRLKWQKVELEKQFTDIRSRAHRLEELLPKRISSEQQREVLSLLCKVHELEIEKTEMQSNALLKDNVIRQTDYVIQRFEQHRQLCAEIIQQQRQIIDDHNLLVPSQLDELYEIYLRELEEGNLDRIVAIHTVTTRTLKDGSVMNMAQRLKVGDLVQDVDSDQESVRTIGSEKPYPWRRNYKDALPPLVPEPESDNNQVFKSSPHGQRRKSSTVMTPPPIQVNGMLNQETNQQESLVSFSEMSSASSHLNSSPDSTENFADNRHNQTEFLKVERKQMLTGTKNIAVKAARRRSKVLENDNRLHILEPMKEKTSISLHSMKENEESFYRGILEPSLTLYRHQQGPLIKHAASEDNLSTSTGEVINHVQPDEEECPTDWSQSYKKENKKASRRQETLEAKRKKRRSRSFEVNGQGLSHPKNISSRFQPLESISDNRFNVNGQSQSRIYRKPTHRPGKVKFPISHYAGESDLHMLEVVSTPPSTIYQRNANGRGLAVQKKVRGPTIAADVASSTSMLNQPGNFKKPLNRNPQPHFNHTVTNAKNDVRARKP